MEKKSYGETRLIFTARCGALGVAAWESFQTQVWWKKILAEVRERTLLLTDSENLAAASGSFLFFSGGVLQQQGQEKQNTTLATRLDFLNFQWRPGE